MSSSLTCVLIARSSHGGRVYSHSNMPPTLQSLQVQIDALQAELDAMRLTNGLPRDLETSLNERLSFLQAGTSGSASFNTFSTFNVTVPKVTGTLSLTTGGITYKVFYE